MLTEWYQKYKKMSIGEYKTKEKNVKKKEETKILNEIDPIIKMDKSKHDKKISNIPLNIITDDLNDEEKHTNFFVNDLRLNRMSNHDNSSFFSNSKKYSNLDFIKWLISIFIT